MHSDASLTHCIFGSVGWTHTWEGHGLETAFLVTVGSFTVKPGKPQRKCKATAFNNKDPFARKKKKEKLIKSHWSLTKHIY